MSDQFSAVKDLAGGAVTIKFRTTATSGAASLLSSADPISQVRDLVVSLNSGKPYVEFRTGSSTYPIRIQSSVNAANGNDHELIFASSNGISSLILDGEVIGQTTTQRFFRDVDDMTPVHGLNPTGLPNLTLGGNRAYVTPPGRPDQPLAVHRYCPLDPDHRLVKFVTARRSVLAGALIGTVGAASQQAASLPVLTPGAAT